MGNEEGQGQEHESEEEQHDSDEENAGQEAQDSTNSGHSVLLSRIERTKDREYGSFIYLLCLLVVCGARFPRLDLAHEQELYPQDGRDDNQGPCHLSRRGAQIRRGARKTA